MQTSKAEIMKNYSLEDLQKPIWIKMVLGDIVSMKASALRKGFYELADKLDKAEKQAMRKKKK